ncbi:hypothetical protein [Streptomyces sp. SID3212]|uniref:hypothetical protein n=1 Tax=Streptomyces sp. SID3212 TaxID=2690259 RepID=UPI0013707E55|nr:hypothetical protein [Streptomyces sp. SID3212]MYV53133.1 hypothetical protein [Streptomyces sp. SID3212]
MGDYDEMTAADVMSGEEMREYDKAGAALLDAQDEERWAAEAAAEANDRDEDTDDDEPFEGLGDGEDR